MAHGGFVYQNTALWTDKTDRYPVTDGTRQWAAADSALAKAAAEDLRAVLSAQHINVLSAGAVGDGTTNDGPALQAAITAAADGRPIFIPRVKEPGGTPLTYRFNSTLFNTTAGLRIIGQMGTRGAGAGGRGTELVYYGTGPAFQNGVDNGHPWSQGDYDGPQDIWISDLCLRHGAPDTATDTGANFKAGAYGFWDWRGGGLNFARLFIERFEANLVGINSDICRIRDVTSLFSKYGLYIGPRSDQFTLDGLLSYSCDRAITVDGARLVRILNSEFVGVGNASIGGCEVRRGSGAVHFDKCWFEHLGSSSGTGYTGTDGLAVFSVGEIDGAGGTGTTLASPGSVPNTLPVETFTCRDSLFLVSTTGVSGHLKYIAAVDDCNDFTLTAPAAPPGVSLGNFTAFVGLQAGTNPTNVDTQIAIREVDSSIALSVLYQNLGTGTPALNFDLGGSSGVMRYSSNRFSFRTPGAAAGAEEFRISQEGQAGNFYVECPTFSGGQTVRLRVARSFQPGNRAAAPASGTWAQGDIIFNLDPIAGGFIGWVCVTGGTPGTWKSWGVISP